MDTARQTVHPGMMNLQVQPEQATASSQVDRPRPARALFRRLVVINGLVFTTGTLVLALSPASVSSSVRLAEIPVLIIGLGAILTANAVLVRRSLAPLAALAALMERVDLLRHGDRMDDHGSGDLADLIRTFNEMLDRLEAERSASNSHALAAQEAERERIARELHDEIGQSLTVVLLNLKRVVDQAPVALREDLQGVQEEVRSCIDEVQQVARRLRPGVLSDLGLHSSISALSNDFSAGSGVAVTRKVDAQLPELSSDVELVLYRVAQEGLTNVARHAHATHVELSLSREVEGVMLRIRDNGVGGVLRESAGIRGMRERALLVGGTLTIDSRPGHGTDVTLVVPYQ